ncbi:helix-turn-helix domain-containing protein [Nocardia sp. SYP-A9097]|uniref:helix-turn-helix domain-containing protein n=1 Tax=Nocardia sp. SYP-A9097 TaxID=2663237 RepID=UPI001323198E|nr:helix-turn-helix transcriptional regulator [Nocardia sp. SYP-A9097]MRH90575.1 helix-turn-helix domain-containing protein [Nocardia sp. SYP-A9097]
MSELGEFLKAKRASISPEDVGLPAIGNPRRVRGLRREEVALLAAVSVDHYTRLEQGRVAAASENLLAGIARALRLNEEEHEYLRMLVRARPARRGQSAPEVSQALRDLLDTLPTPAFVLGPRTDILAWNAAAAALFVDFAEIPVQQRALVRLVFLDPRMRAVFTDWEAVAAEAVDRLRMAAARTPDDPRLTQLVGELSVHDADFRRWWAGHGVRAMAGGRKRMHHPVVGDLELDWQVLQVLSTTGQSLVTYTAPVGSPSHEALRILASWAAQPPAERTGAAALPIDSDGLFERDR